MTRINVVSEKENDSVSWGKTTTEATSTASVLIFAAALIACSIAVGCSSEQPKPVTSNHQIPVPQIATPAPPVATAQTQPESKPAKKVVHKAPSTINFTDKTYGVSFEYPRRYAIETGDAANQLLMNSAMPMNFVQPGGVALAAIELPESNYANTDFSSAFFNVSVNKSVSAEECSQFAVPKPKNVATVLPAPAGSGNSASSNTEAKSVEAKPADPSSTTNQTVNDQTAKSTDASTDKLLLTDMELRATEAVSGEGTRQSDSRYFHVYQNGACYEFAMNVTTDAFNGGLVKHVDRDRIFDRLEKIMATVKIEEVKPAVASDTTAETPATPVVSASPAQ